MAGRIPLGKAILMTTAITGLGYGIMAYTTPSDEEFYNSLSPDLKRKVDEHRARQAALKAAGLPNNKGPEEFSKTFPNKNP